MEKIREAIKKSNITTQQAADVCHVSRPHFQTLLNKREVFTVGKLIALGKLLGKYPSELMDNDLVKQTQSLVDAELLSESLVEALTHKTDDLNNENIGKIVTAIYIKKLEDRGFTVKSAGDLIKLAFERDAD